MPRTNLIITGFMGTGKSTIGRLVAELTGMGHVDVDDVVEERYGTIASIFASGGESLFRELEQEVAADLALLERTVISTGGQTMLHEENLETLGASGTVICLVADPDLIYERLTLDTGRRERPMLTVPDPRARITELLEQRAAGYARFPQVSTDGLDPVTAARAVIALWEDRVRRDPERT